MGPVPFRTARGAGRLDFFVERPLAAGFLRDWLPDDRVVDADAFAPALAAGLEVPFVRDAGGEDVRVAMVPNVHSRHSRPLLPTPGRPAGSHRSRLDPTPRRTADLRRFLRDSAAGCTRLTV
jgi:hypothetical protein